MNQHNLIFNNEICVEENNDKLFLILPEDCYESEFIQKAYKKVKGVKWEVHRYDKDPFPSIPHLHNYEDKTKLDPFTGNIYSALTKQQLKKLKWNLLKKVQEFLIEKEFVKSFN